MRPARLVAVTPTPTSTTPRVPAPPTPAPAAPSATDPAAPSATAPASAPVAAALVTAADDPSPDARTEAARLLGLLAAHAVRRDRRVLHHPLDAVAPWARSLPPAAWREFAEEVRTALDVLAAPPLGTAAGQPPADAHGAPPPAAEAAETLEPVLRRWSRIAARFA